MIDPEKKLWQRVLLTAVEDALTPINYKRKSPYDAKIIKDARNWILNNNSHYFRVCSMADINPLSLRAKIKETLSYEGKNSLTSRRNKVTTRGCVEELT